jgi:selenide,water dikinase
MFGTDVRVHVQRVLFDPQTSGGLLISVAAESAARLLSNLRTVGIECAAIIGDVVEEPRGKITVL